MITWEYLAGFIDGDGCFGIYATGPRLTIGQNHRGVLEEIREFLDIRNTITLSNGCNYFQIGKQSELLYIIEHIRPYLIVKAKDADRVYEYCLGMKV